MEIEPTQAVLWSFAGGAAGMLALWVLGAALLSAARRDWPYAAGRLLWSLPLLAITAYAARTVLRALGAIA